MAFLSRYYYNVFINLLKNAWKPQKSHYYIYKVGTMDTTKYSKKHLNRILGVVNALSESEKRKREHNTIKDIKNIFRLRKEINNHATKDKRNLFRLKTEN